MARIKRSYCPPNVVTRGAEMVERNAFRFLELPLEIRLMIYELVLNFNGVNEDQLSCKRQQIRNERYPFAERTTPALLLVNLSVSQEAFAVLKNKPLLFTTGLYRCLLESSISVGALQRVTRLEITDMDVSAANPTPLKRYSSLVAQLSKNLGQSHSLKHVHIALRDPRVLTHVVSCQGDQLCDHWRQILGIVTSLSSIKGVQKVTVEGALAGWSEFLKMQMGASFLHLPRKVRDMVYDYALASKDVNKSAAWDLNAGHSVQVPSDNAVKALVPYDNPTTPTVLLLNRQITKEALERLQKRTLV